jgi:hypothetical protein
MKFAGRAGGGDTLQDFQFNVNTEGLVEALGRMIFTNPDDAVRELIQNAQDACILRKVQDPGFNSPHIEIQTDGRITLSVSDNGIGMTEEDLRRYLATIGQSSKKAESAPSGVRDKYILGESGIGIVAMLMVADTLEVVTKSFQAGAQALRFTYSGGNTYHLEPVADAASGTRVTLQLKQKYEGAFSESHLMDAIAAFKSHIVVPVLINGRPLESFPNQGFAIRESTLTSPHGLHTPSRAEAQGDARGLIRFSLAGSWSVRDFASWLNDLQLAYLRLSAFFLLSEGDTELLRLATKPYVLTVRMQTEFDPLMRIVAGRKQELRLSKIEIASPGFAELIGSLNPLKTIADFITAWRHENTLRDTAMLQANLELRKTLADHAASIVQAAPSPDFVDRFLRFALDEPRERLELVARDLRLEGVSVREIGPAKLAADSSSDSPRHEAQ